MNYQWVNIVILGLFFFLIVAILYRLLFEFLFYGGVNKLIMFGRQSFSIDYLIALAAKQEDMSESFKSFYDMKYQHSVFIIKGIGGMVVLFISTFLEKIVTQEKTINHTDLQLLAVTSFLILLILYLSINLRKIPIEYAETLRIYYTHRPWQSLITYK